PPSPSGRESPRWSRPRTPVEAGPTPPVSAGACSRGSCSSEREGKDEEIHLAAAVGAVDPGRYRLPEKTTPPEDRIRRPHGVRQGDEADGPGGRSVGEGKPQVSRRTSGRVAGEAPGRP